MCHQRDIISCRPLCVFLSQAGIETAGMLDASKWFYSMEDIFNIWIFFWNFVHIHSLHRLTEFRHGTSIIATCCQLVKCRYGSTRVVA